MEDPLEFVIVKETTGGWFGGLYLRGRPHTPDAARMHYGPGHAPPIRPPMVAKARR